jgi:hypothetical protein
MERMSRPPPAASPAPRSRPDYRVGHRWRIEGPIDLVFHYLSQTRTYPEWWPAILAAHTDDTEVKVGARVRVRVKSALPYSLDWDCTVTRVEPPHVMDIATDLVLGGRFRLDGMTYLRLREDGAYVEVVQEEEFWARQRLPAPLRAVAGRLFAYNHAVAAAPGERGLQRVVRAALAARDATAG